MTPEEIYNKINNTKTKDPETGEGVYIILRDLYYEHKENEAVVYIQTYFKCDEDTAKEVFLILKKRLFRPPPSPEQIALCNAAALAMKYAPRCPYCNSTNLHRITTLEKAADTVLFGVYGNTRRCQWHCYNCNSDF